MLRFLIFITQKYRIIKIFTPAINYRLKILRFISNLKRPPFQASAHWRLWCRKDLRFVQVYILWRNSEISVKLDFLTILSIRHLFPRLESTSKSKQSSFKGRRLSFKFGILPDRSDSTQSQPATTGKYTANKRSLARGAFSSTSR